jgi:dihydrolipoamide dehydrogenase
MSKEKNGMDRYKVAIIGGGPGGYETAIRLSQLGISVICFEKNRLGGVCLNQGCIPTKSLVKVAELYHEMSIGEDFGLQNVSFDIDYKKICDRKDNIVKQLVSGIELLFQKRHIPVQYQAVTQIVYENNEYIIYTDDQPICSADYIVIATGSTAKELPFLPLDARHILSSDHMLIMRELPRSLAIIGGGVIGCEFACIYNQMGVEVHIIEFLPEIIPTEDEEISKRLAMSLKKSGIKIYNKTAVESGKIADGMVEITLSSGKTITIEKVLVSVGRQPVFDIDTVGFSLCTEKNFIAIDDFCQTSQKNVFAIGDVTGKLMLAHTASKQGLLVADYINHLLHNAPSQLTPINYQNIPSCIFTSPEVASCGLTEKQASGRNIKIGRFPYSANGKALASGATFGFVKTIIDSDTDEILGIHIIGLLATEIVAQASILLHSKAKVSDVANIIWAHPTISECLMESIEDTHKMAIHTL